MRAALDVSALGTLHSARCGDELMINSPFAFEFCDVAVRSDPHGGRTPKNHENRVESNRIASRALRSCCRTCAALGIDVVEIVELQSTQHVLHCGKKRGSKQDKFKQK